MFKALQYIKKPYQYIGRKSINLDRLMKMNSELFEVPEFIVLPSDIVLSEIKSDLEEILFMQDFSVFSVRSSGSQSAPGRMKTKLNVTLGNLQGAFEEVQYSVFSKKLTSYLAAKGIQHFESEIIIQKMILPEENFISGVFDVIENKGNETVKSAVNAVRNQYGNVVMSGSIENDSLLEYERLRVEEPELLQKLEEIEEELVEHFGELQEFEFLYLTDSKKMFLLQTRNSKLSNDSATENVELTNNKFDYLDESYSTFGKGKNLFEIPFEGISTYDENNCAHKIFVSNTELDYENVEEIAKSRGIIALRGGELSHAAVIAREFNIPCVISVSQKNKNETIFENVQVLVNNKGFIYQQLPKLKCHCIELGYTVCYSCERGTL